MVPAVHGAEQIKARKSRRATGHPSCPRCMYSCGVPLTSDSTVAIGAAVPSREPERAMFVASDRFLPLEYLGIPHRIAGATVGLPVPAERRGLQGFAFLTVDGSDDGPRLYWPRADDERLEGARPARHDLNGIPLYARVIDGKTLAACLPRGWHAESSAPGAGVPVWRHDDGSILLPFDPAEAMELLWSERDLAETAGRGLTSACALHHTYRLVRLCRGVFRSPCDGATPYPGAPRVSTLAGRASPPRYRSLALRVLTEAWRARQCLDRTLATGVPVGRGPDPRRRHTAVGQAQIGALRDVERELGIARAGISRPFAIPSMNRWWLALRDEGCEVGVHGANHDGPGPRSRCA